MLRKLSYTIILGFCLLFINNAFARKAAIYNAYISGRMDKWKAAMDNFGNQKNLTSKQKLELVTYYYGYIGYNLGVKKKDEAKEYIKKGDSILDELIANSPTPEAYALKGAFVGFHIGINPLKAPFIGSSSGKNVDKALALDKNSIQANIEKANVLYYSPSAFGGDKAEAKKYYSKAIALFESNPELMKDSWLYLSLLTQVAQVNIEEKKYKEAKAIYDKIMTIEPNYSYVKNELYPQLLKLL